MENDLDLLRAALAKGFWKRIPEFPSYEASSTGEVRDRKTKRILKTCGNGVGYPVVSLGKPSRSITVHRLVLSAFSGPCPPGHEARHLDGNRGNNFISNLKWGTRKENAGDRRQHGTNGEGEKNSFSKLTVTKVRDIRKRYQLGETQVSLGRRFGVSQTNISLVLSRKTWGHVK